VTDTPEQQAPACINARAAAGVLFTNEQGEILMVTPSYKDYLDIPGGYVEPGESPSQAAIREVKEELGIDIVPGRLLVIDWWVEGIEQADGAKVLFVFDGGLLTDEEYRLIAVDGSEVVSYAFVKHQVLDDVTVSRLANRLRNAVAARLDGSTRYLENGARLV
jgi:8-oxo-dGTP pyrophosphatase MutT (NUDIX family)